MRGIKMKKIFLLIFSLTFISCSYNSQENSEKNQNNISLVSWNIQTFFDAERTGTEYEDFIKKLRGLANEMAIQQLMAHSGR